MWLITNFGFFSVVEKPDDASAGTLTVRARVKQDLETLRDRYLADLGPIVANAGTDYRYRAKAPRGSIAAAAARAVQDIDYHNFKNSVAKTQGHERAHVYSDVWHALNTLQEEEQPEPPQPASPGSTPVVPGTSYGGVLIDDSGHVLLREPAGHYDGYHWTFPKGRPADSETSAEQVALREALEETGYHAKIIGRVPGTFAGGTGQNIYFLMTPIGSAISPDPTETESIRWVTPSEAQPLIDQTMNAIGRNRDRAVLEAAVTAWRETQGEAVATDVAPDAAEESLAAQLPRFARKLLLMIRELHRRGHERLRAETAMSPSGCYWRCTIGSALLFSKRDGARIADWARELGKPSQPSLLAYYSTGSYFDCFDWGDCVLATPKDLADRFEREFPTIIEMARGSDPEYVHWLAELLDHTEPIGLPIAYADWPSPPPGQIEILSHPDVTRFRSPPPGLGGDQRPSHEPGTEAERTRSDRS